MNCKPFAALLRVELSLDLHNQEAGSIPKPVQFNALKTKRIET